MKYLVITLLTISSIILLSCQSYEANEPIAIATTYNKYFQDELAKKPLELINRDLKFWGDKLASSPKNFTYMSKLAGLYSRKFKVDGNVVNLHISDSLYKIVLEINPFSNAVTYQALGTNAITKHEFNQAKDYAQLALKEGDKKLASYYLLFDAFMELGQYDKAVSILEMQSNKNTFSYLIRASKLSDHDGNLDEAIQIMETAYDRVKSNPSLFAWGKSNLADMYGHAGRIEDSYKAYLEVLEIDPAHWHSWQGIAYIAFAHDNNLPEAKRILNYVESKHHDPQVKLLLAEIAEFENDEASSTALKKAYYAQVAAPKYLGMYSKYLILLEAEDLRMPDLAIQRANQEQEKRPTPEMYDLLAWTYYQNGDYNKALKIAALFVEDKTSEPEALYHLGVIMKMNGEAKKSNKYLSEALESTFELGPLTTKKIKQALKS